MKKCSLLIANVHTAFLDSKASSPARSLDVDDDDPEVGVASWLGAREVGHDLPFCGSLSIVCTHQGDRFLKGETEEHRGEKGYKLWGFLFIYKCQEENSN